MVELNFPRIWRRSSRCDIEDCVEVAFVVGEDRVLLRNSREPGQRIEFTTQAWRAFCAAIAAGEWEQPETGR